jgi:Ca2+/H+ antiporter
MAGIATASAISGIVGGLSGIAGGIIGSGARKSKQQRKKSTKCTSNAIMN